MFRRTIGACMTVLTAVAAVVSAQASPQLSASSITVQINEPWLLYGDGLDGDDLEVLLEAVLPGEDWDAGASLRRVLDGRGACPVHS